MLRCDGLVVYNIGVFMQDVGLWWTEGVLRHPSVLPVQAFPVPGGVEDQ